jgi:hypothetical protein
MWMDVVDLAALYKLDYCILIVCAWWGVILHALASFTYKDRYDQAKPMIRTPQVNVNTHTQPFLFFIQTPNQTPSHKRTTTQNLIINDF